jgi:hypothetical protein
MVEIGEIKRKSVAILIVLALIFGAILMLSIMGAGMPKIVHVGEDGVVCSIMWEGRRYDLEGCLVCDSEPGRKLPDCDHVWSRALDAGDGFKPMPGAACMDCGIEAE